MGLFSRNPREPFDEIRLPSTGLTSPVTVEPGDFEIVDQLMEQFNSAIGNNELIQQFGPAMQRAGGWISFEATLDMVAEYPGSVNYIDRPWRWLAAVANEAEFRGNYVLTSKIAGFTEFWSRNFAPNMTPSEWAWGMPSAPPDISRMSIGHAFQRAARNLDADSIILQNSTGKLTVNLIQLMVEEFLAGS
jgi:hypothetical protein